MLPGPREARLQSVRDNQAQRLSVDTHAAREARLQSVRDTEVVCGDLVSRVSPLPDPRREDLLQARLSCCRQDFRFKFEGQSGSG